MASLIHVNFFEEEAGIAPAPADDPPFEIPRPLWCDRPCARARHDAGRAYVRGLQSVDG
ncbi:hypothetical protein MPLB_1880021 [Mesorhizobium sp. ORS 3324]|nr:hypothetical protein MPLB_1880021 [Mesorhizobium sp. ORS 3324]